MLLEKQRNVYMLIQRLVRYSFFTAFTAVVICQTGCVTNGRRILLKEYGPSVLAVTNANLNGTTVYLKDLICAPNLISFELKSKAEEPTPYSYIDRTREQDKLWDAEQRAMQKQINEASLTQIGNMRNGFGMVMSHVYAMNHPATWFREALKYDLEAQGAKVVDASQADSADVTVSCTIQRCSLDMYMTVDGQLVVDLDVQPKQGEARHRQIHTHGATAAVLASEGEYFHALRDCREKFSIFTIREISQALKPKP
jgi:hypothetical protein